MSFVRRCSGAGLASWMRTGVVVMTVLLAACAARPADADRARVETLADAERAFAAAARTSGVKAAFLGALADDATLFRPGPVAGKPYIAARPDPAVVLEWKPQRAGVARSGEIGFSTGPYRIATAARPDDFTDGQFFSVWRRSAAGRWEVLFDHGIAHPGPLGWSAAFEAILPDPIGPPAGAVEDAEASFARASAADGLVAAYGAHGSTRIRLLRDSLAPLDGLDAATGLPERARTWRWTTTGHAESAARDLAWTTGRYRVAGEAEPRGGSYVRVWRAEAGTWKIVADVVAPTHGPLD